MQRAIAKEATANVFRFILPVLLLLCLALSGCGDTCFSGFFNGSVSGVGVSNTSCTLGKTTGTVFASMSMSSVSEASGLFPSPLTPPRDVQHIFITLRGIEAHPSITADEDSSTWQELVPGLAAHPLQLDLLAPSTQLAPVRSSGESPSLESSAGVSVPATVPADEYRRLRLRLMPLHSSPDDLLPETNACGNAGWNCIVFADGSVRPLEFGGAAAEFHIPSEPGADNVFRLLPDEVIHLSIEFDAGSSAFFPSNTGVRITPVFKVVSRSSALAASSQ